MKQAEIDAISKKHWLIKFVDMPAEQLTLEIARYRGAQWYQLTSGRYILSKDFGDHFVPGATKVPWPEETPPDYILDTDSFPDWGKDPNAAISLGLELREQYGDPYRLLLDTDPNGRRRWIAMFRKSYAYAWGDTPAEALCRAYLIAYEILTE